MLNIETINKCCKLLGWGRVLIIQRDSHEYNNLLNCFLEYLEDKETYYFSIDCASNYLISIYTDEETYEISFKGSTRQEVKEKAIEWYFEKIKNIDLSITIKDILALFIDLHEQQYPMYPNHSSELYEKFQEVMQDRDISDLKIEFED